MSPDRNLEFRPEHFEALVRAQLSDATGPLFLADDLAEREVSDSRTLTNTRRFLVALREEGHVKATKKLGNLSRSFSTRIWREFERPTRLRAEDLVGRAYVDEVDVRALYHLRVVLQQSGLVRKYRGSFHITKNAERLLDRELFGELYRTVFLGWFDKTNIALTDGMPEDSSMQYHLPFTLWALRNKAHDWKTTDQLAACLPHDDELWEAVRRDWARRFSGASSTYDELNWALEHRILRPLVDFGLLECDPVTQVRWDEAVRWRVTPLFDRFMTFDFSDITERAAAGGTAFDESVNPHDEAAAEARAIHADHVVTLKITLRGTKPPVWRRVEVPASYDLEQVHRVLNAAMGWFDYHLHEFDIEGRRYGVPDTDWSPEGDSTIPEETVILGDLSRVGVRTFTYRYDFGDDWTHTVAVESVARAEPDVFYPRCTDGRRAAVPEDCGGVHGFSEFLDVMAQREHPEHDELESWYGSEYDPVEFSAEEVSRVLHIVATGKLPDDWTSPA